MMMAKAQMRKTHHFHKTQTRQSQQQTGHLKHRGKAIYK